MPAFRLSEDEAAMPVTLVRNKVSAVAGLAALTVGVTLAAASHDVRFSVWPSTPPIARDPTVESFVSHLLAQLTLEEKIGQMIQADIASITPAELKTYKLGSILAGGNAAPRGDLRSTPAAWLAMTDEFYRASLAAPGTAHPPIPILFGIDAVHGNAKLVGATIYPHNVGLGAAHDPDLIRRIGAATAAEVAAIGVDWAFAPTVAVVRDVRWGRSYESYSEDPGLVARYAPAMVTGLQGTAGTAEFMSPGHVLSSVKHFLGDGGTLAGRDQGNTAIPEAELSAVHGAGYPPAIKAGALIVMASYNSWNGEKLHTSHYLLTDVLKGRLGFDGFVIGDWNAHEQIPGCTKSDCAAAILAGVDMLMAPDGWKALYENTLAEARSGEIPAARIDDAVRRILRVKALAGLFSKTAPTARSDTGHFQVIGSAAHRDIAREAVRKSLVLLKNNGDLLPLQPTMKVLVAGRAADDVGIQSGGWTIDWQADHNSGHDFPGASSIFAGIQAAMTRGGGSATLSPDGRFTDRPDVAIVVFGEGPYAEFEGDRENLAFSPDDHTDLNLLRALHSQGIPTVAVFISGRPLWVNPELNASDAFVAAWLPGSEGEGVADVLIRGRDTVPYDFVGRLGFSWPQTAMPVTFDSSGLAHGALFARGYGLDYSQRSTVPVLAEDPRIDERFMANTGNLFHAGHPTAPWSLFVADGEDQVHVTSARQNSPHGVVSVTTSPQQVTAAWSGTGLGILQISGRARDMTVAATRGTAIVLRYRVERAPTGSVRVGMKCTEAPCNTANGAMLDVTAVFKRSPLGVWSTLTLPLSCFRAAGADLSSVEVPLAIASSGHFVLTIVEAGIHPLANSAAVCPLPSNR
jgi:beta-glucosidase